MTAGVHGASLQSSDLALRVGMAGGGAQKDVSRRVIGSDWHFRKAKVGFSAIPCVPLG